MSLTPVSEARALVLDFCPRLHPAAVPLDAALGLVTSVPIRAEADVPAFANSAMDGYAVRSTDIVAAPVRLSVVGTIAAGAPTDRPVRSGEAMRIMTGAAVPAGADAVVMVERTEPHDDGAAVTILQAVRVGDHIRGPGEDVASGQEVFAPFTVLQPGHIGVLASLGMSKVPVFKRARVGVLSTGDELAGPAAPLGPGQIRDSNRPTLLALAVQAGCEAVDLGTAPDTRDAIADALGRGLAGCDAIVTSGGVSVGDFDYVKVVLDELSAGSMRWMQVAVKPAKPLAFGVVSGRPVFGLPGNPVSSIVSFELFVRPALRRMMGHTVLDRLQVDAVADEGVQRRPDGKLHLVRAHVEWDDSDGRFHVRAAQGQGSHMLRAMALANALAMVPDGDGTQPGGNVKVMLLSYP
ncbi:MAG TPA: gephyrin-like molybdotransferase Glp [Acidimicrobiales bacterium]|nr:gephyrin-like molybdotransferase Glp [Acidimicrobiales bacterium]